jgi:class 3 adenylate cyclase
VALGGSLRIESDSTVRGTIGSEPVQSRLCHLGRIGFEGRYDYGALGPVTNLASRLSTHALPRQVLIGPRIHGAIDGKVKADPVGEVQLKGFARPIQAYALVGRPRE